MGQNSDLYQYFFHRYLFTVVERDGDKLISKREYAAFRKSYGLKISDAELNEEMGEFDADGDGKWSQQEFLRALNDKSDDEGESEREFQVWDRDGDGFVSEVELRDLLVNIGAVELAAVTKALIKEADLDSDGKIRWEEFISVENMI